MEGKELRILRNRLGFTQARLAHLVDVAPNTIARYERGELRIPSKMVPQFNKIAVGGPSGSAVAAPRWSSLDPHLASIIDGLQGQMDPELFESCAVELIRDEWPVVPVSGGTDDGFDGAIADGEGQAFPLIVTTSRELARNLRSNLKQSLRKGWNVKKVIFATSRRINGTMRRKLRDAANAQEAELVQIYDQTWFAYRLYTNSVWCKLLLGLTGRPRALSIYPKTRRPVIGDVVLGREAEMQWLVGTSEDSLLVGGPGSGKTFLLRAIALEGHALFLVDDDMENIANDLRELRPNAVIIDDAHVRLGQIEDFLQIRQAVGAEDVKVIASCWPGDEDAVSSALHIFGRNIRTLPLLDADTMVEIIKSVGVRGPRDLIALIREQAGGRPGLAATLAHLSLAGDIKQVASGEAIVTQLASSLDAILSDDAKSLLAVFALGGDYGFTQDKVAEYLGMSIYEIRKKTSRLAAAGIIRDRRNNALSVEPEPMRWALVRDVFFSGATSLSYEEFLETSESREHVLSTLVCAYSCGAVIPRLIEHLEDLDSATLWKEYAYLGAREAAYVLARHPEALRLFPEPALLHMPRTAIPMLLEEASSLNLPNRYAVKASMEILKDWTVRISPDIPMEELLERRSFLIEETEHWWQETGDHKTAVRAMCLALNPSIDYSVIDPGVGNTVTYYFGKYPEPLLRSLTRHWPRIIKVVREADDWQWDELLDLISDWRYSDPSVVLTDEVKVLMEEFSSEMMRDIINATREHPGIQHKLGLYAKSIKIDVVPSLDDMFELFYPEQSMFTLTENDRLANKLATHLELLSLGNLVNTLEWVADEARLAGIRVTSPVIHSACKRLAACADDPLPVAEAFVDRFISEEAIDPFLKRAVENESPGWVSLLQRCLHEESYQWIATRAVLTHVNPPADLLLVALSNAEENLEGLRTLCAWGRVPDSTLNALFDSEHNGVAAVAAAGHWFSEPKGSVDDLHRVHWRQAILRASFDEPAHSQYWLTEIISRDSELAKDWLILEIERQSNRSIRRRSNEIAEIIQGMSFQDRLEVLNNFPAKSAWRSKEVVAHLVGDNVDLYRGLLKNSRCDPTFHMSPLAGKPDDTWAKKALAALDAGYSMYEVVVAAMNTTKIWRDSEREMWSEWREAFESLEAFSIHDPRLSDLATAGVSEIRPLEQYATERDRQRRVQGYP